MGSPDAGRGWAGSCAHAGGLSCHAGACRCRSGWVLEPTAQPNGDGGRWGRGTGGTAPPPVFPAHDVEAQSSILETTRPTHLPAHLQQPLCVTAVAAHPAVSPCTRPPHCPSHVAGPFAGGSVMQRAARTLQAHGRDALATLSVGSSEIFGQRAKEVRGKVMQRLWGCVGVGVSRHGSPRQGEAGPSPASRARISGACAHSLCAWVGNG